MIKANSLVVVDACVQTSSGPEAVPTRKMIPGRVMLNHDEHVALLYVSVEDQPARFIWRKFIEEIDRVVIASTQMQGEPHFVVHGINAAGKYMLGRYPSFEIAHQHYPEGKHEAAP